MSREGYTDYQPQIPTAPPLEQNNVHYINSYPNNYVYHNQLEIQKQIEKRDREVAIRIQKMENQIQQEKEKKSIWKRLCFCLSCLFCCLLPCGC
jgi:uncharacterized membrane protein YcjF (UPF0283 family)